jgi:transposase-like protein
MSREAVDLSVPDIQGWTEAQCHEYLVEVRFGSRETVSCPHCGTLHRHYWRGHDRRWKCAGCGNTFSITSGTVFANRKRPLKDILTGMLMWINSAAGQPALELKRHMNTTYNTVFVWQQKMREGLVRGYNVGLLSGDIEMDGAHQAGRRSLEKRGRPQGSRPLEASATSEVPTELMLTQTGQMKAKKKRETGAFDPEFGRKLPKDRRILFAVRKRSGRPGKGASVTRVAVGLTETSPIAESILKDFVAMPESWLNTDSSPAYQELGKRFMEHRTVEHSKELSGPEGQNNNQAEEYNWRYDRAEKGIYLNIEPKYLLDYAVETAFRSDTRRLSNGKQLRLALHVVMSVGESLFWKGYTRGHHRKVELIHPLPQSVPASGPAKGSNPRQRMRDRPPR